MSAGMDVLEAGQQIYAFADMRGKKVQEILAKPDFGSNVSDFALVNFEVSMQGLFWQLAGGLMKEMTEPLKSIVNK